MHSMVEGSAGLLDGGISPGMHLPQVDVVGVEATQRSLQVAQQSGSRGVDNPFLPLDDEPSLRGDDEIISADVSVNELPDELFGEATTVCGGGIDQISTGIDETAHHGASLTSVGLAAPGQGTQTNGRHLEAASPDGSQAHVCVLLVQITLTEHPQAGLEARCQDWGAIQ